MTDILMPFAAAACGYQCTTCKLKERAQCARVGVTATRGVGLRIRVSSHHYGRLTSLLVTADSARTPCYSFLQCVLFVSSLILLPDITSPLILYL